MSSGGGINLFKILNQPYLITCNFISCFAYDDGGSAAIWNSSAANIFICTDCQFIKGNSDGSDDPWAGGIIIWNSEDTLKCSNLCFSLNTATYGGAYAINNVTVAPNYVIYFCFFNRNTADYGNDAGLFLFSADEENAVFLYCFSTTEDNRIGYRETEWINADFSWLPHGSK